jgi:hypothetical protein
MVVHRIPRARIIKEIPIARVDLTLGDQQSVPKVGDIVSLIRVSLCLPANLLAWSFAVTLTAVFAGLRTYSIQSWSWYRDAS